MKSWKLLGALSALVVALPAIALADPPTGSHTNAGSAKDSCEVGAGGVFVNASTAFVTLWRCTIVTTDTANDTGVPASHPQQDWTVDVERETERTEIYEINRSVGQTTWQTVSDTTDTLNEEVTACYNHQGNSIGGFQANPNCQLAFLPGE
jgi:hypothetical protein